MPLPPETGEWSISHFCSSLDWNEDVICGWNTAACSVDNAANKAIKVLYWGKSPGLEERGEERCSFQAWRLSLRNEQGQRDKTSKK